MWRVIIKLRLWPVQDRVGGSILFFVKVMKQKMRAAVKNGRHKSILHPKEN